MSPYLILLLSFIGIVLIYGLGLFQGCWHSRKGKLRFGLFWLSVFGIISYGSFLLYGWVSGRFSLPCTTEKMADFEIASILTRLFLFFTIASGYVILRLNMALFLKWLRRKP